MTLDKSDFQYFAFAIMLIIVIGLLCNEVDRPVLYRVFPSGETHFCAGPSTEWEMAPIKSVACQEILEARHFSYEWLDPKDVPKEDQTEETLTK